MRYIIRIMALAAIAVAIALMVITAPAKLSHEKEPEGLEIDVLLPTTPVKNQGRTPFCWAYAMLATLETDRIVVGDSVNLSPQWIVREHIADQVINRRGKDIQLNGTLPEAFWVLQHHGVVPWDSYNSRKDLHLGLKGLKGISKTASDSTRRRHMERALDNIFGPPPLSVFMLGAEYTPVQFAQSIAMPDEWTAYVSTPTAPYGKTIYPDLKDNIHPFKARNVSPSDLLKLVYCSLTEGHPVAWEGDMRPERRSEVYNIERQRQQLMRAGLIDDDHAMAIIGTGHNDSGRYLIMKNSWGGQGRYYMPEAEFMLSTVLVMVRSHIKPYGKTIHKLIKTS